MTTHISTSDLYLGGTDWLTKIHNEVFPNEGRCGEIMLDVHDTVMHSQPFVIDDLVAALRDAVDLFENDEACNDVGTDEWVWHQQAQMILEQYEGSQPSESYAEKLADAYVKHGTDPLVLDIGSFLGVKDPIFSPPPPPPPPPSLTEFGKHYFEIRMPDFNIKTTVLAEPARDLSITSPSGSIARVSDDGWVHFTMNGPYNWLASIGLPEELEDNTPEGILFSKIED